MSVSVEQGWTRPNRTWRGQQSWTGAAGRAVLDSTEPVRIGLGQDRENLVRANTKNMDRPWQIRAGTGKVGQDWVREGQAFYV